MDYVLYKRGNAITTTAIIIPSIRKYSIEKFITEWNITSNNNYTLIVIEDNDQKTFRLPSYIQHYSHAEIDRYSIKNLIAYKTDAIRIFGFWKAYKKRFDYILTLDDDCLPFVNNNLQLLCDTHIYYLNETIRNTKWFCTLDRDFARGHSETYKALHPVKLSVGGWVDIPDIDGKAQLRYDKLKEYYPKYNTTKKHLAYSQMYTMCGMHLCFPVDMVKYMYYLPHENTFFRWADIWMGFIVKRWMDQLEYGIANGSTLIKHSRASNACKNYELENTNNGYSVNAQFAQYIIDSYKRDFESFEHLLEYVEHFNPGQYNNYFRNIAIKFKNWYNLFISERYEE